MSSYERLCSLAREVALLESIDALLGWDERTLLPAQGGEYRADQMTYLAGLIHRKRTDPVIGELLGELATSKLASDPHSDEGTTIRQLKREYDKRVRLPVKLVEELARATVVGQQAWVEARKNNNFAAFRPHLEKIYELKRQQAAALGFEKEAYDALLDEYEPGAKTADVAKALAALRAELVPLVTAIQASSKRPPKEILARHFPLPAQEAFGKLAAAACGFDFERGRLDVTAHPFCSGMGPNDCRITTRYREDDFGDAFFSILHEAGHGIYEQGLRRDQFGLPPGGYVSLGIHESQSRLWENLVGRSRAFWQHFFPEWQRRFPAAAEGVGFDDFFFAINTVEPSLIRVDADEATYNLHIIVRFELEQALLKQDLAPADLPGAWREKYRHYLGIEPSTDADGVLQDVHWSAGLVGYFPTYTLGNMYAAQFFEAADKELGGLAAMFARGEFLPLREWLREKIHSQGQRYTATQLNQRITGQPLSPAALMRHLRGKLEPLYAL